MVPALSRRVEGTAFGCAAAGTAVEFPKRPAAGCGATGFTAACVSAHAAAVAAGLPVDSRPPRRRAAGPAQAAAPRAHAALRRDTPLGPGGPRRAGNRDDASARDEWAIGSAGAHH